jgi:hypothetical protein
MNLVTLNGRAFEVTNHYVKICLFIRVAFIYSFDKRIIKIRFLRKFKKKITT